MSVVRSHIAIARLEAQARAAGLPLLLALLRCHLSADLKTDLRNQEYDLMHWQDWNFLAHLFYLPGQDQNLSLKVRVLKHVAMNYAHRL